MRLTPTLPALLLCSLCSAAFAEPPSSLEACMDLASRSFASDPTMQQRWQQTWLDASSVREESYTGEVKGEPASKALRATLRKGEQLDGHFTCLLADSGKPLSVQYQPAP